MSFIAKWIEISHSCLENKFDDRITLIFPSYSCQEYHSDEKLLDFAIE